MVQGGICFRVREDGKDVLIYHFSSMREAAKTFDFVSGFFPSAQFIFEPSRH